MALRRRAQRRGGRTPAKRQGAESGEEDLGRALVDDDDVAELLERIDAESQARRLYEAMDRLSDGDRDLLELVALDGLAVRDAARLLGVTQAAARVRLHRARQLLRNSLAQPMAGLMVLSERIVLKVASP